MLIYFIYFKKTVQISLKFAPFLLHDVADFVSDANNKKNIIYILLIISVIENVKKKLYN